MDKLKSVEYDEKEATFHLELSKAFYEREAVFAAAIKFSENFGISINPKDESNLTIIFISKNKIAKRELENWAKEFLNELLDQQVRLDLEKRFSKIREMIVKHAFAPIKNLDDAVGKIASQQ